MSSDEKFWIAFWALAAAVAITAIISVACVDYSRTQRVTDLIAKGADPIKVHCALSGTDITWREKQLCYGLPQVTVIQQPGTTIVQQPHQ